MNIILQLMTCLVLLTIATAQAAPRPNILMIQIDEMGYGDPGCYNPQSKIKTTNIDALAKEGMRFADAHTAGLSGVSSQYGLLTGTFPFRADFAMQPEALQIEASQFTLPSMLRSAGYSTAMVGQWHGGGATTAGPGKCGFDTFFSLSPSPSISHGFHVDSNVSKAAKKAKQLDGSNAVTKLTETAIQIINKHCRQSSEDPFMLYLSYPGRSARSPVIPKFLGKSAAGNYGDYLMSIDAQIGALMDALGKNHQGEKTIVIISASTGPDWKQVDADNFNHRATWKFSGKKGDLLEGGHRVPLIIVWPQYVKPASFSHHLVCLTDLVSTFAKIVGCDIPADAAIDSYSLLTVLRGRQSPKRAVRPGVVIKSEKGGAIMIRQAKAKLISYGNTPGAGGQLYNLAKDIRESKNLYVTYKKFVTKMGDDLKAIIDNDRNPKASTSRTSKTASSITGKKGSGYYDMERYPVKEITDPLQPYSGPSMRNIDNEGLKGKIITGYQGWFNCEGDGADLAWTHWARGGGKIRIKKKRVVLPPKAENITIDIWPDTSELDDDELFDSDLKFPDGTRAQLFSSYKRKTVIRHFKWMAENGINAAFLQRFINGMRKPEMCHHKNMVLSNVREGANRYGRAYAVMYDLTGLPDEEIMSVYEDFQMLETKMEITKDASYQHLKGKPLVILWGIGFNEKTKERNSLEACTKLIKAFKKGKYSLMLGTPSGWREQQRDALDDPGLHEMLKLADVISPWSVGRFKDTERLKKHVKEYWAPDIRWTKKNNMEYMPVLFPGFSWYNNKKMGFNAAPRLKGDFLWAQVVASKKAGAEMIYFAMFDEVDEGTAMFKCVSKPPTGTKFVDYEGMPSDFYLQLAGHAGKVLRGEIPLKEETPTLDELK